MFHKHLSLFFFSFIFTVNAFAIEPPKQPLRGPGGLEYRHKKSTDAFLGEEEKGYWIFEPEEPRPESAPVIVFMHGWGGVNPEGYRSWITHLVNRGNIVIYPLYQSPKKLRTPLDTITNNAITAVKEALEVLKSPGHVKPDLEKFAVVGHSAGGMISANMTALATSSGLPRIKAAMIVEPGRMEKNLGKIAIPLADLSTVSPDTLVLVVVGDKDRLARDRDAKKIFYALRQIPAENKDYVVVNSDDHGDPPLRANHLAPVTRNFGSKSLLNTLDYNGFWKLFDGLTDAAFYNKNREFALGNTKEQRFMGKWSDDIPVKELTVTDQP